MSGYTKHVFNKDLEKIKKEMTTYINNFIPLLPYVYSIDTIKALLEEYYPYEWFLINEKYEYYCIKEKVIRRHGKKSRFDMDNPSEIIQKLPVFKKISGQEYVDKHQRQYNEEKRIHQKKLFKVQRKSRNKKIYDKIQMAKNKTQLIEPEFLDKLTGLYDKKNTSQKDKVYIVIELKKYYCPKVIQFFSKKVDTEYNVQLRRMAFEHLQSFGFQPVLPKQKHMRIPSKNKKRRKWLRNVYAKERFDIKAIPEELEYRIDNSKDQLIKSYDFFISHSSADYKYIQELIQYLNVKGNTIYCDWINDNDYLKRELVGKATLFVIEKRLQQSKLLIFVKSSNSSNSNWCKYELNYFSKLKKPIYVIEIDAILNKSFNYNLLTEEMDLEYNEKPILF